MRGLAIGLLLAIASAGVACSAQEATPRELAPLPGITSPSTVVGQPIVPGEATVLTPATTTTPPATTSATSPRWPFGDFRSVPQLGTEPVSGHGCGADGTIGDVIPDGWWLGIVTFDDSTLLQFDLVCAYSGIAAQALIDECLASVTGSTCTAFFNNAFWPVNRITRERTVPRSASFVAENVGDLCTVQPETRSGGVTGRLDWLLIENGLAVYTRRGCGTE